MAAKKGAASTRDPVLKRAKLVHLTELKVRGNMTNKDCARIMGVHEHTIENWTTLAKRMGIVEEVSQRMAQELLPKAAKVYETILDADVEEITASRTTKAHELKLKAAKSIAEGLGALGGSKTLREKKTIDVEEYLRRRDARHTLAAKRVEDGSAPAQLPEILEGELVDAIDQVADPAEAGVDLTSTPTPDV